MPKINLECNINSGRTDWGIISRHDLFLTQDIGVHADVQFDSLTLENYLKTQDATVLGTLKFDNNGNLSLTSDTNTNTLTINAPSLTINGSFEPESITLGSDRNYTISADSEAFTIKNTQSDEAKIKLFGRFFEHLTVRYDTENQRYVIQSQKINSGTLRDLLLGQDQLLLHADTGDTELLQGSLILPNVPTLDSHAVRKDYVDNIQATGSAKFSVYCATTTQGSLSTAFYNGQLIDGVIIYTGYRILIKDQLDPKENGIYIVNSIGSPTRSNDMMIGSVANGVYVLVQNGTTNSKTGWIVSGNTSIVVGTDNITFSQFTGIGTVIAGTALQKPSANLLNVLIDNSSIGVDNSNRLEIKSTAVSTGLSGGSGTPITVNSNLSHVTGLGTVSSGVWQASPISVSFGGTGRTSFPSNAIVFGNLGGALQTDGTDFTYNALTKNLNLNGYATFANGINAGISSPTISSFSNTINCSNLQMMYSSLFLNGSRAQLDVVFQLTPIQYYNTDLQLVKFQFPLPSRITTFAGMYQVSSQISGYDATSGSGSNDLVVVMNAICVPVLGTTRMRVQFQPGSNNAHFIHLCMVYSFP